MEYCSWSLGENPREGLAPCTYATLSGLGWWLSLCWKLSTFMGVGWETGLMGHTAGEHNESLELGGPCCWEGKTTQERNPNAEKLPWERTGTESKLCTAELARGGLATVVTPLQLRRGAGPFSLCGAVRAVDARVVPMARFTGVTKSAVTKRPAAAPIIPGVGKTG